MLPESIVYLCILISLFGSSLVIKNIIKGEKTINLVSWFLWAIIPLIAVYLQLKAGAGASIIPVFFAGLFPLIIFTVALFKGGSQWNISKFDILCGFFSVCSLAIWIITNNTGASILFAILADLFAAFPTFVKSWKFPETETPSGYVPGILNNLIGLLIIKNWSFSIYSFSLYIILLNTSLVFLISRKKLFPKRFN
jgi:hypothetical protein